MIDAVTIPEKLREKVSEIGPSVAPKDIDAYRQFREIEDQSQKLRLLLQAWKDQHTEERKMRQTYATAVLIGLGLQVACANLAFFLMGFKFLSVDQWVANTFFVGVFTEIVGMTFLILKYLFPKVTSDVLATIEKL